ncbi:NADPH-dependent F420 reductase [Rhizobium leguminosarum]|uniref:NADPH-dependent F420 reductase n=1 Tax=Rhizobium leguminosarum TaxID=384 RepID=UPI001C914CB3|nr:NAD(P)-binding domain-containing protein [Rhizobium leguminosarum]MBY2907711.1 NAD(P)-binding domain-containing protein [Rhizobium leguminosarum]
MNIGIIGAGHIGGSLTRRLAAVGHKVFVANSRGPETLADLANQTGAKAVTAIEAARSGEIVIVTIPQNRIRDMPKNLFRGVDPSVIVVDTGNYYPRQRDGKIAVIESGVPESRWVETQLNRPVLKAFNTINWKNLLNDGKPAGTTGRIALPVSGDDASAKARLISIIDDIGFDAVDAGGLAESWRQQPDTPVYSTNLDVAGVRRALSEASPQRKADWFAE